MTKDEWIQQAKALLFDCTFCVDANSIKKEIDVLMESGGGYDPVTESSKTPLRWPCAGPHSTPRYEFLEKEQIARVVFRETTEDEGWDTWIGPCIMLGQTKDKKLAYIEVADLDEPFDYQEWLGD